MCFDIREYRIQQLLLIDDDETYILALKVFLKHEGYHAKIVTTVAEARKVIKQEELLLICSDLDLPDGSDMDLLTAVRIADQRIPFLLVSNHEIGDYETEAMQKGATLCLEKMKVSIVKEKILEYAVRSQKLQKDYR